MKPVAQVASGMAQQGWRPAEIDPFWGEPDAGHDRWSEMEFHQTVRPPPTVPFLWWSAAHQLRFGAFLLGIGFFAVFVEQAFFLYQLVIGAPVFEEMFKAGLALVLTAWLIPRSDGSRAVALVVRLVAAWGVGAGFAVLEHFVTYPGETDSGFVLRILFHAGSTGLSVATYTALEPLRDVRARWFSTALASLLHYANNAAAPILVALSFAIAEADALGAVWSLAVSLTLYATTVVVALRGPAIADFTERRVLARLLRSPPPARPARSSL